jgi:hypothetical protein
MRTCFLADLYLGCKLSLECARWSSSYSFPQCFGPKENEPLDPTASETAFRTLREQIIKETGNDLSMDEMVCRSASYMR